MKRAFVIALTLLVIGLFACANRPVATFAQTQGLKPTTIPEAIKKLQQLNHMTPGLDWPEQKEIKAAFMSDKTPMGQEGYPRVMILLVEKDGTENYFFSETLNRDTRDKKSQRLVKYTSNFSYKNGEFSNLLTFQVPVLAHICDMDMSSVEAFNPHENFPEEISARHPEILAWLNSQHKDITPAEWHTKCNDRPVAPLAVTRLAPPTEMTAMQVERKFSGNLEVIFIDGNEVRIPSPLGKWRVVPTDKVSGLASPTTDEQLFQRIQHADIGDCTIYVQTDERFTINIMKGFGSDKKQIVTVVGNELSVKTINADGKDEPLILPYLSAILKQWPELRPLFQELLAPSSGQ